MGTAPTADEIVAAYRSQIAYTGTYRIEADRIITTVDSASLQSIEGTEQVRVFRLEGSRLQLSTLRGPSLLNPGKISRTVLLWEKIEH